MKENVLRNAVTKASLETSRLLSAQLRKEARASGWPSDVVRGVNVAYHDGEFKVNAHKNLYNKVLDLEYGTPDTQPTAAIRKVNNRTAAAESFFVGRLSHMLGDMK